MHITYSRRQPNKIRLYVEHKPYEKERNEYEDRKFCEKISHRLQEEFETGRNVAAGHM